MRSPSRLPCVGKQRQREDDPPVSYRPPSPNPWRASSDRYDPCSSARSYPSPSCARRRTGVALRAGRRTARQTRAAALGAHEILNVRLVALDDDRRATKEPGRVRRPSLARTSTTLLASQALRREQYRQRAKAIEQLLCVLDTACCWRASTPAVLTSWPRYRCPPSAGWCRTGRCPCCSPACSSGSRCSMPVAVTDAPGMTVPSAPTPGPIPVNDSPSSGSTGVCFHGLLFCPCGTSLLFLLSDDLHKVRCCDQFDLWHSDEQYHTQRTPRAALQLFACGSTRSTCAAR